MNFSKVKGYRYRGGTHELLAAYSFQVDLEDVGELGVLLVVEVVELGGHLFGGVLDLFLDGGVVGLGFPFLLQSSPVSFEAVDLTVDVGDGFTEEVETSLVFCQLSGQPDLLGFTSVDLSSDRPDLVFVVEVVGIGEGGPRAVSSTPL